MAEWNQSFCVPSLPCCLTFWGCGCIPIYQIIDKIAPFNAMVIPVEKGFAAVWAVLFWIGSVYAVGQATIVFVIVLICFTVGAKNKLEVQEDSIWTAVKTFFCAPCMIGQIAQMAFAASGREPLLLGEPVLICA
mmetsp:Transcript_145659/g.405894  ORF Transcript_145659/g.405894 Transcript_145659/m.405894 type:complete len:134 (-) Transcript_145659:93-494(-)